MRKFCAEWVLQMWKGWKSKDAMHGASYHSSYGHRLNDRHIPSHDIRWCNKFNTFIYVHETLSMHMVLLTCAHRCWPSLFGVFDFELLKQTTKFSSYCGLVHRCNPLMNKTMYAQPSVADVPISYKTRWWSVSRWWRECSLIADVHVTT